MIISIICLIVLAITHKLVVDDDTLKGTLFNALKAELLSAGIIFAAVWAYHAVEPVLSDLLMYLIVIAAVIAILAMQFIFRISARYFYIAGVLTIHIGLIVIDDTITKYLALALFVLPIVIFCILARRSEDFSLPFLIFVQTWAIVSYLIIMVFDMLDLGYRGSNLIVAAFFMIFLIIAVTIAKFIAFLGNKVFKERSADRFIPIAFAVIAGCICISSVGGMIIRHTYQIRHTAVITSISYKDDNTEYYYAAIYDENGDESKRIKVSLVGKKHHEVGDNIEVLCDRSCPNDDSVEWAEYYRNDLFPVAVISFAVSIGALMLYLLKNSSKNKKTIAKTGDNVV